MQFMLAGLDGAARLLSMKMRFVWLMLFCVVVSGKALAQVQPGDYSLRALIGPGFNIDDWEDQFRVGGEFDYDLGYNMGIDFVTLIGVGDEFRFQMIPGFRYNYLYIGLASFYALAGAGLGHMLGENTLDLRFATGLNMPLGQSLEAHTHVSMYISTLGLDNVTPVSLDWMIGIGKRFH
ncbi:MAG: hypothetical protein R3A11_09055 [Bdellovibrionota bacterium]